MSTESLRTKLQRHAADGSITDADADAVEAFAEYLREIPAGMNGPMTDTSHNAALFKDRDAFIAWRMKWLPFMAGIAPGPVDDPDEYFDLHHDSLVDMGHATDEGMAHPDLPARREDRDA